MLPVVVNTLCCEVSRFYTGKMPRVVPDQREKFENDELFRKLSRESEVNQVCVVMVGLNLELPGTYGCNPYRSVEIPRLTMTGGTNFTTTFLL